MTAMLISGAIIEASHLMAAVIALPVALPLPAAAAHIARPQPEVIPVLAPAPLAALAAAEKPAVIPRVAEQALAAGMPEVADVREVADTVGTVSRFVPHPFIS